MIILENIEAVVYDLDGTIIDTNALHVDSLNHVGKELGFKITADQYSPLKGLSSTKTLEALLPPAKYSHIPEAVKMRSKYLMEHVGEVEILGHFREAYDQLATRFAVAVCTSARQEFVDRVLESVPTLRVLAGKIICKERFKEGKPSAEPLRVTLKHLGGLNADQAVYIGDAHADYGSAINVGMDFFYFCDSSSLDDQRIPQHIPRLYDHQEIFSLIND